jgi:phosphoribosylanthranilate isomerase
MMRAEGRPRLFVKICGITSVEDGRQAVEAGADALGFVFWPPSPRYVTPERAAAITAALPPLVVRVGVFVDASRDELARTADAAGLDLLQLHGQESPECFAALPRRALKALRVGEGFRSQEAEAFARSAAGVLLDTHRPEAPGGTGRAFDWTKVRGLRERVPFLLLAGGLTPDNVADAIDAVDPHGVDVSSGVEAEPGRKDVEKLRAFVEAARGGLVGKEGR